MSPLLLILAQVNRSELNLPTSSLDSSNIKTAVRIVFGILGGIAVLIITIAGFQYVASQGDPQATAKAKNSIIDAFIGLIISILAYSIVSFVFTRI